MRRTLAFLVLALFATAVFAADVPEKEPGPRTKGKILAWKAKDGLIAPHSSASSPTSTSSRRS